MIRRILAAGVAIIVVAASLLGIALISGHRADAGTVTPLVSVEDVARALRGRGFEVAPTGKLVVHPRLSAVGEELQVNGESVIVYIFPGVKERVEADQELLAQRRILTGGLADIQGSPRIVPVRNALLVHEIQDAELAMGIYRAASDLARAGGLA